MICFCFDWIFTPQTHSTHVLIESIGDLARLTFCIQLIGFINKSRPERDVYECLIFEIDSLLACNFQQLLYSRICVVVRDPLTGNLQFHHFYLLSARQHVQLLPIIFQSKARHFIYVCMFILLLNTAAVLVKNMNSITPKVRSCASKEVAYTVPYMTRIQTISLNGKLNHSVCMSLHQVVYFHRIQNYFIISIIYTMDLTN